MSFFLNFQEVLKDIGRNWYHLRQLKGLFVYKTHIYRSAGRVEVEPYDI